LQVFVLLVDLVGQLPNPGVKLFHLHEHVAFHILVVLNMRHASRSKDN
jgi:hypothetical protein